MQVEVSQERLARNASVHNQCPLNLSSASAYTLPTRRTHFDTVEIKYFILQATIPMVTFVHRAVPAWNLPYLVTFGLRR